MSNDNHGMRIKNHVIVPSKWVSKLVKLILMTAVMLSLFTSAAILTQNGNGNVAFAKKATTATKDTGTATKTIHTVDTVTPKKSSKDTGGSSSGSGSGSTSGSGSGSGSGSSSSSTSTSDTGPTTSNGNGNPGGAVNTALPPNHVTDPNHIFYDKCAVGQHSDPVTHACVKDEPHKLPHCTNVDIVGCHCPKNAMCPVPNPKPNPPCNISSGNVASATCHCQTNAMCPPPKPPVNDPFKPHKCATGSRFIMSLGCVKNHLTRQEAFNLGYKLGLTDGDDQENYVGTGGYRGHSAAFTAGYNCAYGGVCPPGFVPPK